MNSENVTLCSYHYSNKSHLKVWISDKNPKTWQEDGKDLNSLVYREAVPGVFMVHLEKSTILEQPDDFHYKLNLVISDFKDETVSVIVYLSKNDLYNLQRVPFIMTYITVKYISYSGQIYYCTPLGIQTIVNIDLDNVALSTFPDVSEYSRWCTRDILIANGYSELDYVSSWSSNRVLAKAFSYIPEHIYEYLFGCKQVEIPEKLQEYIDSITMFDIATECTNDMIEIFPEISSNKNDNEKTRKYDITLLKKLKVALLDENGNFVDEIKKTYVPINKNKKTYYGEDVIDIRNLVYNRLIKVAKEKYNVDNIALMEAFWVKKKTTVDYIEDKNGVKHKTLYIALDAKTHLPLDDTMFLSSGAIVNEYGEILYESNLC